MKIKMGISPMNPETAEKRHWTVSVIRAFGIIQVIGSVAASYFFLRPFMLLALVQSFGMQHDPAVVVSLVLAIVIGLLVGFISSAMTFSLAMFLDDVHTIRNYMRDYHLTGQYYDD